jgi:hypothetical protein
MMKDWILLLHAQGNMSILQRDIKEATSNGLYSITLLIETVHGSYNTVSAHYYDDLGDELYALEHNSYNFTLDEIKRYAILKIHKD